MTVKPVFHAARSRNGFFRKAFQGGARAAFAAFGSLGAAAFLLSATAPLSLAQQSPREITDANPLAMPEVGDYRLQILSPTLLELTLINTREADAADVPTWNFIGTNFSFSPPSAAEFAVTAAGRNIPVKAVGFKRRPLYAALAKRDLRIGNYLYLELGSPIADNEAVRVANPNGRLWNGPVQYEAPMDPLRLNPAIHVNQLGYMPGMSKKAAVGYYVGSMGEMNIPAQGGFQLLDAKTGAVAYEGALALRPDEGFSYSPTPYQQVFQADFTEFETPGEYKLYIPGLGTSFPFRIDAGVTASFARTFALGLYHQRCGSDNHLPVTRHTHEQCHLQPVEIPTSAADFPTVDKFLAESSKDWQNEPRHTAPQLKSVASSLYPFVNKGTVKAHRGHHDAGDYSKYTINSAGLVHFLVFAADAFPGAGSLDNLGLPESGDGKSDLLQEAKWEADFLASMQDADGGFYFLVYPKNRRYENNVLPENGDSQVVWPKNTAVTAAAVGALAEAGSSPLMKEQFPAEAANYLEKARLGWTFLMKAIAKHGKNGAYQKMTHYGHEFMHDDELAWAAAAMYAATGEPQYQAKLFEFFPNPNDINTRRWSWWKLFEGYGCAVRTYAFAARTGRLPAAKLNKAYLAQCEAEIVGAADDHARFSRQSAYGTSLPDTTKMYRSPGWFFSSERTFDVTVGYQITPKPEYIETIIANCNYEGGSNPLNMPHVTGIGFRRQQEVVSQYAWNDRRILPPAGLPQGNVRQGYGYLQLYTRPQVTIVNGQPVTNQVNDLPYLSFPADGASTAPYAYYDRWTDMVDTVQEFVIMDQARSLASLSFWMAQGPARSQPWKPVLGQITGLEADLRAGKTSSLTLTAPGLDLSTAQVVWEVRFLQPSIGNPVAITPRFPGEHWIEAEALLPDGRRVIASTSFVASTSADVPPNAYQSEPLAVTSDIAALYHADEDASDATGLRPPLILSGNAKVDRSNLGWMAKPAGGALRFLDLGDSATVQIPSSAIGTAPEVTSIALEAMIYINSLKGYDRGVATILKLYETHASYFELREDKYAGLLAWGGQTFSFGGAALAEALKPQEWHHLSISLTPAAYILKVNGIIISIVPSSELGKWGHNSNLTLTLGNFDGWLDEVAIRSFKANARELPNVSLITPISGTTLEAAGTVSISAAAAGNGSSIQKVEFFAGSTRLGEDTTAPYEITWTAPPGNYTITAKATDTFGLVGISAPAGVTVLGTSPALGANAVLRPVGLSPDGAFVLRLTGEPGKLYRVQGSENHRHWTDLGLTYLAATNAAEFKDPNGVGPLRFYRAILVQ